MTFWAIIKDKDDANSNWYFCEFDGYGTKREVQENAKANGYTVRNNRVYTETEYSKLARTSYDWQA